MIMNIKDYMVMVWSYVDKNDKVRIAKFRDGKYYMSHIEFVDNDNVVEKLQNMNEDEAKKYIDEIFEIEIGG